MGIRINFFNVILSEKWPGRKEQEMSRYALRNEIVRKTMAQFRNPPSPLTGEGWGEGEKIGVGGKERFHSCPGARKIRLPK